MFPRKKMFFREFIEREIVQFAQENPGTAIYLKPRRHRSPVVVAEYRKSSHSNEIFSMNS